VLVLPFSPLVELVVVELGAALVAAEARSEARFLGIVCL
jgi:hypothetical protein